MMLTDIFKHIIQAGAGKHMTDREFLTLQLAQWQASAARRDQITGTRYLNGQQDILNHYPKAIGKGGRQITLHNVPNAQIVDNQYARMVEQKANYLCGKPPTITSDNDDYAKAIMEVLGADFGRTLNRLAEDALCGGLAWLMPYYDKQGAFRLQRIPAYQVLPFWADADHTELDAAVYIYNVETWEGTLAKIVPHVQVFTTEGIYYFSYEDGALLPEEPWQTPYARMGETAVNWNRIPLIAFRANQAEQPLINRVKGLQDAINMMESAFENGMLESPRNTIMVIVNYDGEDLSEFRQNLATYGAVKVRSTDGASGDVRTLQVEVNAENYRTILSLLKQALIENARGYDAKDDRLNGNPNQMNIQSMYSDIDLDAHAMEAEFKAAFRNLLWFVNAHLANTGRGDHSTDQVTITFNRDVLVNNAELIDQCRNSVGLLSTRTILEHHPMVTNVEEELKRLKEEQAEQEDQLYFNPDRQAVNANGNAE